MVVLLSAVCVLKGRPAASRAPYLYVASCRGAGAFYYYMVSQAASKDFQAESRDSLIYSVPPAASRSNIFNTSPRPQAGRCFFLFSPGRRPERFFIYNVPPAAGRSDFIYIISPRPQAGAIFLYNAPPAAGRSDFFNVMSFRPQAGAIFLI